MAKNEIERIFAIIVLKMDIFWPTILWKLFYSALTSRHLLNLATGEWACSMSPPKKSTGKVNIRTWLMHLDFIFFPKYSAFIVKLSKLETKCETLNSLNFTQGILV